MSRVNAYLEAGNDAGRRVSVGGRASSDSVWARLNTNNATGSDCALKVSAEVTGPGLRSKERRLKSVGDGRRSVFTVELPRQCDENCEVTINLAGEGLRELARISAALCGVKGAMQVASGDKAGGIRTIKQARALFAELESAKPEFPNVVLPGGVTLKHALACVRIVQDLIGGTPAAN
jgi:hypothetical protein